MCRIKTITKNEDFTDNLILTYSFLTKLNENLILNVPATALEKISKFFLSRAGPRQSDFEGTTIPNSHSIFALKKKVQYLVIVLNSSLKFKKKIQQNTPGFA